MSKPRLISGIQPSGKLHLGNYLGAIQNFIKLQNSNDYECLFFIADYHSLTSDPEPEKLQEAIYNLTASFLALGLDPEKSVIFQQSSIKEHNNLAYVLSSFASYGRLKRMTQFKEKSENQKDNINVGLFYYPILMAADILIYNAEVVPVGDDQVQHLEITRDLARKFNNKFGETFKEPEPLMTETPRIMSLDNPDNKMSKTHPSGCVFLDDSPEVIQDKVGSAVTDSDNAIKYDKKNKAAISNLLRIYSSLSNYTIEEIEKEFKGKGYADFKKSLADVISKYFEDYRNKKTKLISNKEKIKETLEVGDKYASAIAKEKIEEVKKKTGLSL